MLIGILSALWCVQNRVSGAMATQIYQEMTNQGFGDKDFASAYLYLKNTK